MDKVKITREQANLLDGMTTTNVGWIFTHLAEWQKVEKTTSEMAKLHRWYIEDPLTVSKALIIGYEVEETPEDKVRELYIEQKQSISDDQLRSDIAIREVLNLLNIKIAGVNHD